ncbi:MAG: GTPase Era [Methanoregulaceae archaeon PtaB.Bin152]|nr:MAG: GTPase Era [Methanoregulaceae archaeon PtaB.Bin152]OPY44447.1 MAG: GTPase Era [Methanoregulaceae archaeon PtaU1.Bin222]
MPEPTTNPRTASSLTSGSLVQSSPILPDTAQSDLRSLMNKGITILRDLGPVMEPQEKTLTSLRDRLAEGRFQLAVLGQFKRGKSTLLNALLGEDLLPSSVIPLTAIPTFIRYGQERSIHVHFQDQRKEEIYPSENVNWMSKTLLGYVSENVNPKNEKGVSYVEITHPSPLLSDVVLIDTPGIGSTHRHNTEMTLNFLPQCDAALFLVSADPPITEVEVDFLRQVREKVSRVFFVLNKIDYLSEPEREMALTFLKKVLDESVGIMPDGQIFPVSAKQALMAKETGDPALLAASGLPRITEHLIDFLAREKTRVLREAVGRKALDVLYDTSLQVNLEMRSLEMPITDLEQRLTLFQKKIDEAKRQRQHTQDIPNGDHKRIVELLEEDCAKLRETSRKHLETVAASAIASTKELDAQIAEDAIAQEIPVYFEHTLGQVTSKFDSELITILSNHQERAAELVESIRVAATTIFDIPHHSPAAANPLVLAREPYWVSRKSWSGVLGTISPDLVDKALPRSIREKRIKTRIGKEIQTLVVHNVENLRWATLQNIDAAFRVFSRELDEDLAHTVEATYGAIEAAYTRRKEHADEIADRTRHLQKAYGDLQELIDALVPVRSSKV